MDPVQKQLINNACFQMNLLQERLRSLEERIDHEEFCFRSWSQAIPQYRRRWTDVWSWFDPDRRRAAFKLITTTEFCIGSYDRLCIVGEYLEIVRNGISREEILLVTPCGTKRLEAAERWGDWDEIEKRLGFEVPFAGLGQDEVER
ncbi:hypothetical protein RUND412_000702, partial [Rhizina undulata]